MNGEWKDVVVGDERRCESEPRERPHSTERGARVEASRALTVNAHTHLRLEDNLLDSPG